MIVTTTQTVDGKKVKRYLGLVSGVDLYNAGGLIGGGYTSDGQTAYFRQAISTAKEKMISAAGSADAIVGTQVVIGSSAGMNQVIDTVTGTAVKLEDAERDEPDELPDM